MIIDFNWFNSQDVKNIISMLFKILDIVRIVVPIALIAMTTLDITKKVINPDDKDGQKKIMIRAISALIVFLSPIIVNLVLNFMGIDTTGLGGINTKVTSRDTSPTYVPPKEPVKISSVSLFGCPSSIKIGESVELKTNIPANYKGSIIWEDARHILDVIPSSDKRSATIKLLTDKEETTTQLTLKVGDIIKSCNVRVDASFSITNCPSKSKKYKPGEKLTLVTDINSSYNGKVLWEQSNNVFKMKPSEDGRSMVLEVVDNPPSTVSLVTAIKDNKKSNCTVFVEQPKLDSLSIINCPHSSNIRFDPGEEITLITDIPDTFKGDIKWHRDLNDVDNDIIITPSADGRSATIKVNSNPTKTYSTPIVSAGGQASSCTIFFYKSMQVDFDNQN